MERLSSGLRVNSAKDDAAGQAVANRMTSQINGYNQAQRNMNDGISYTQSAEGYLDGVNDNLQRVRELTVQALNGTNKQEDLTAIQAEIEASLEEIKRVFKESEFNGTKIFSGDSGRLDIQVGYNDGETISTSIENFDLEKIGLKGFNIDGSGNETFKNVTFENDKATPSDLINKGFILKSTTIDGVNIYEKENSNPKASISDVAKYIAAEAEISNDPYSGGDGGEVFLNQSQYYIYSLAEQAFHRADTIDTYRGELKGLSGDPVYSGSNYTRFARDEGGRLYVTDDVGSEVRFYKIRSDMVDMDGVVDHDFSSEPYTTSVPRSELYTVEIIRPVADPDQPGESFFRGAFHDEPSYSPDEIEAIFEASGDSIISTGYMEVNDEKFTFSSDESEIDKNGLTVYVDENINEITYDTGDTIEYYELTDGEINTQENGNGNTIYIDKNSKLTEEKKYEELIFDSPAGKTIHPLKEIDESINQIDEQRSHLGSFQNRLESAIENSQSMSQDLTAARSRIEDADYAAETASLVKAQILQQASTSMLAQANQAPELVLRLLG